MHAFELDDVASARLAAGTAYHEFLRVPALSAGLYVLPAGGDDPQQPHAEDELYLVTAGRATIRVGGEDRPVAPGSLVYVPAHLPHRFHTIQEDLSLLVLFAPAESASTEESAAVAADPAPR